MEKILIIFGAKYLILISVLLAAAVFFMLKEKRKEILVFALITLPISFIISRIISKIYYDPRPFVEGNFAPLIAHEADNGFPSDHTLLAGALAGLVYFYCKKIGIILWILAFLVGFSRVAAGVHHWVDVLASLAVTFLVSYFSFKFLLPKITKKI